MRRRPQEQDLRRPQPQNVAYPPRPARQRPGETSFDGGVDLAQAAQHGGGEEAGEGAVTCIEGAHAGGEAFVERAPAAQDVGDQPKRRGPRGMAGIRHRRS